MPIGRGTIHAFAFPLGDAPPDWEAVEARLMRKVVQIGEGKIFGSFGFVTDAAFALGDRFRSRSVTAREVDELGYATHGWRIARSSSAKPAA